MHVCAKRTCTIQQQCQTVSNLKDQTFSFLINFVSSELVKLNIGHAHKSTKGEIDSLKALVRCFG